MSNYGITGWSGGVRQSLTYNLKAGQMRGMGRVNVFPSNTTIINNSIFGSSCGVYDNCCSGSDGMSGFTKTMLGIGMGTSLLGTILGFFGIGGGGKSEGAGGTETPKEPPKDVTQIAINTKNDKPTEVKPETDDSSVKPSEPETQELKDGTFTSAIDEALGSKSKIQGEVSNKGNGTVSIKDTINTYTYQKGTKKVTYNGKQYEVYSLTGATNNKTGKAVPTTEQEYILINGQLVQPKDCKELAGLGTGSVDKSAPPRRNADGKWS